MESQGKYPACSCVGGTAAQSDSACLFFWMDVFRVKILKLRRRYRGTVGQCAAWWVGLGWRNGASGRVRCGDGGRYRMHPASLFFISFVRASDLVNGGAAYYSNGFGGWNALEHE